MARDISGGACFVAAAVDRSDGYCKEGRGGRYYIWQRWIAALMLLGGGGGRNMRRSRDPLRTGVLGGYHNSRYLLLFASIAWDICSCLLQSRGIFALFLLNREIFVKLPKFY